MPVDFEATHVIPGLKMAATDIIARMNKICKDAGIHMSYYLGTGDEPEGEETKKRGISEEGRARIAAAQKKRWEGIKKAVVKSQHGKT